MIKQTKHYNMTHLLISIKEIEREIERLESSGTKQSNGYVVCKSPDNTTITNTKLGIYRGLLKDSQKLNIEKL